MNKKHSPKFSDEQLDRLARTILQSTILTAEDVEETAASPRLRWQLQRRIAEEKSRRENRWFIIRRWQTTTAGAFLILLGALSAIWFFTSPPSEIADAHVEKTDDLAKKRFDSPAIRPEITQTHSNAAETTDYSAKHRTTMPFKSKKDAPKIALKPQFSPVRSVTRKIAAPKTDRLPEAENATEFIALSYLPASESGQVVRVKVPRSMLVSLGVSTNVERGKELINAEVVVGDDGAARAIRFLNE